MDKIWSYFQMESQFIHVGLPSAKPRDGHIVGAGQIMDVNSCFKSQADVQMWWIIYVAIYYGEGAPDIPAPAPNELIA